MEQVKDLRMEGLTLTVDESENMEVVSVVDNNKTENMVDVSQDEDLPDASSDFVDGSSDEDDDSTDFSDDGFSDMEDLPRHLKGSYKIVGFTDIEQCLKDDLSSVSNALSISTAESTVLLLRCKWDAEFATERWLADPKGVREEVGLTEKPVTAKEMNCQKCSRCIPEKYLGSQTFCNHTFCEICWQDFIRTSLKDHRLILSCPVETCDAPVNQDMILMLASDADLKLYAIIFVRSYLADNSKGKWCPTPGCNHAVLLDSDNGICKFTCICHFSYCYRCLKEAHQPVGCDIAETWRTEPLKQSQHWHALYTRHCPQCNGPMEVKHWSKHVLCSACNSHFCRTCLGPWLENGDGIDDQYRHTCSEAKLKEIFELEKSRAKASHALSRYDEYNHHFRSHDLDLHQVIMKLATKEHEELNSLAEKQGLPLEEVSFVKDAWVQVGECKRVFKWASVYDYYFHVYQDNRKSLYYNLIGSGAFVMDQLCYVAGQLRNFINTDALPTSEFDEFRQRLCVKTSVARNYFENMESALQFAYPDIDTLRWTICSRESIEKKPETDVGTSTSTPTAQACPHCRFPSDNSTTICVMCYY